MGYRLRNDRGFVEVSALHSTKAEKEEVAVVNECFVCYHQTQFTLVFFHSLQALVCDCGYPKLIATFLLFHSTIFFVLFYDFYQQAYRAQKAQKAVKAE